jgi:hypothetical protein
MTEQQGGSGECAAEQKEGGEQVAAAVASLIQALRDDRSEDVGSGQAGGEDATHRLRMPKLRLSYR